MGAQWEADPTPGLDAERHPAASQPNSDVPFLDPKDPGDEVPGLGKSGGWPARGGWPTLTGELPAGRPAPARGSSCRVPGVLRGSLGREELATWTLEVAFKTGEGGEICSEEIPAKLYNLSWQLNRSYYRLVVTVHYKGYFQTLG